MKKDLYDYELIPDVDMPAEFVERIKDYDQLEDTAIDINMARRHFLKLSGIAGGGLAAGGLVAGATDGVGRGGHARHGTGHERP